MRFCRRIMGLVSEGSRIRPQRRSGSRARSPIELQRLEGRDLLSIAGVSLKYGVLAIQAPKANGNSAVVQMAGSNVQVTLNGASETFSPSLVASITYMGGSGGGDTFTDNTSIASSSMDMDRATTSPAERATITPTFTARERTATRSTPRLGVSAM